tara:strand:- start:363 stop:1235 length:873 start_codon:yes stop_codon:yes gene_type:complete
MAYGSFGFSKSLTFKSFNYPNSSEVEALKRHNVKVNLEVCCFYPDLYDFMQLNKLNPASLKITSGYFPTKYQMNILDRLIGTKVIIEVSEVFPNELDHRIINESSIDQLIINSFDFPTAGEVNTYNQFKKNVRFNITKREYPLPRHMKHIKNLKNDFTVGFYNPVPPGPGYANFFNDLKTNKVFVIVDKFPYGMDAVGINMLTKSKIEIRPNERLMPQDLEVINAIRLESLVVLTDQYPLDNEFFKNLLSIKNKNIQLQDNGTGDLLNDEYDEVFSQIDTDLNLWFPIII